MKKQNKKNKKHVLITSNCCSLLFFTTVEKISTHWAVNGACIHELHPLTECWAPCFVPGPLNGPRVQAARLGPLVPEHHHAPCQSGGTLWHQFTIQLHVQLRLSQLQPVQHWGEEEQLNNVSRHICSAEHSCAHRSEFFSHFILQLCFLRWTAKETRNLLCTMVFISINSKCCPILFLNFNIRGWRAPVN